jgi:hypothetical protein
MNDRGSISEPTEPVTFSKDESTSITQQIPDTFSVVPPPRCIPRVDSVSGPIRDSPKQPETKIQETVVKSPEMGAIDPTEDQQSNGPTSDTSQSGDCISEVVPDSRREGLVGHQPRKEEHDPSRTVLQSDLNLAEGELVLAPHFVVCRDWLFSRISIASSIYRLMLGPDGYFYEPE